MKIAFSTLACHEWRWAEICRRASDWGFEGIELRFASGIKDLPSNPEFQSHYLRTNQKLAELLRLEVSCVDTSVRLTTPDQVAHGLECLSIAEGMKSPAIRVFPGHPPEGMSEAEAMAHAERQGYELAEAADLERIQVLLETHDYATRSAKALEFIERVGHDAFGILWDTHHTCLVGGETLEETWTRLGPHVRAIHVKDSRVFEDGKRRYVLPGQGEFPFETFFSLLKREGFKGWVVVEWERTWHPDLAPAEEVLPVYLDFLKAGGVGS